MASNSLHNLGGQKQSCPCLNSYNFEQNQRNQLFHRIYGLAVNLIMTPSGQLSNIDEILCTLISRLFSKSVNAKLSAGFFCQIIMGSPLNSNVSEGLSVLQCLDKILYSCVFTKKIVSIRKRKLERIQQKFVLLCFRGFIVCYPETEVGKNISII